MADLHAGTMVAPPLAASAPAAATPLVARAGLWMLFAGHFIATWGTQWDVQWHLTIGRDSFWIAPHVMTYSGVSLIVLTSAGVLAWTTLRGAAAPGPRALRVFGLTGTPGYQLAAWGIVLTVVAAPIDDLWHRLFGLDVTLWSPPHLLGLVGALVNAAACWLIAGEAYPPRSAARVAALVVAGGLVYGGVALGILPGVRTAYTHGGFLFFTYPMLAALLVPPPLIATARLSGRRLAPVLVVLVVVGLGVVGAAVSRVGFAWTSPASFLAEEIAKDPTSPIAVMHEMARKNGTTPSAGNRAVLAVALAAAAVMAAVDARRRPAAASLAFAVTLFTGVGLHLARRPAFAQSLPSVVDVSVALVVTSLAALLAGTLAGRAVRTSPS